MKRTTKFALVAGTVLTLGLGGAVVSAHPEGWGGGPGSDEGAPWCWGAGPGYGMGPGYHMGPGYGMGHGHHMGPGYGGGPGYGRGPGYGMGLGGMMYGPPGAVDERMDAMKSTLGITTEQQPAWQGFADTVRKQAENRQAWFDKMQGQSAQSAPDWMAERDAAAKQHQADMESVTAALKKLYGVLTPEQRSTLDRGMLAAGPRYGWRGR
jgi:hypothetical protein